MVGAIVTASASPAVNAHPMRVVAVFLVIALAWIVALVVGAEVAGRRKGRDR